MPGRARVALVVAALIVFASCNSSSSSSAPPSGATADAGFRPEPNGFTFQNYGAQLPDGSTPTNLTAADVRTMFGDAVCADGPDRCDLIPEASAWLDATNQQMAGGHCFGFAVAAELLWQGKIDPNKLGGPGAPALSIDNNNTLQRTIAYDWALQLLDSVWNARITGSPNKVLNKLIEVLKPNPTELYTLSFYKPDFTGGHAVTPFAVQDKGNGTFDVLIYDNNWPGQTRAITFDTKADTWTYDAATNPDEPQELYHGDGETKSIQLMPTSPGVGTQPCPFCDKQKASQSEAANAAGASAGASKLAEIYLTGGMMSHADIVITNADGKRLGIVNGKLLEEIPGAHIAPTVANEDWMERSPPVYFVPVNSKYTVTLDGAPLNHEDTETLGVIGPNYDVSVNNIAVAPGERDVLALDPFGATLSYTSSRAESPTIKIARSEDPADYAFTVAGVADQPGSTLDVGIPPGSGRLVVRNAGAAATSSVNLELLRYTAHGVEVFSHAGIPLAGDDTAELEFGSWTGTDQPLALVTTHNGQATTHVLGNHGSG